MLANDRSCDALAVVLGRLGRDPTDLAARPELPWSVAAATVVVALDREPAVSPRDLRPGLAREVGCRRRWSCERDAADVAFAHTRRDRLDPAAAEDRRDIARC